MSRKNNARKAKSKGGTRRDPIEQVIRETHAALVTASKIMYEDQWPQDTSALFLVRDEGPLMGGKFHQADTSTVFKDLEIDDSVDAVIYFEHRWFDFHQVGYRVKPTNFKTVLGREVTLIHRCGLRTTIAVFPETDLILEGRFVEDSRSIRLAVLLGGLDRIPIELRAKASLVFDGEEMKRSDEHRRHLFIQENIKAFSYKYHLAVLAEDFEYAAIELQESLGLPETELYKAEDTILDMLASADPIALREQIFGSSPKASKELSLFDDLWGLAA